MLELYVDDGTQRKGNRLRLHSLKSPLREEFEPREGLWRALERRGYVHERIIRLPEEEPGFHRALVLGLGWGFMYNSLVRINVTMVREFYANFSSTEQDA
ncbi:hypothetical protein PIB30_072670 [Stylosanthes scabra]|uniref:Uncharacterized protein n=1 Tax=Stylosanthes scabra TaxID=79078 RepID=A0ABU6SPA9_9FABA|nr:hypothetical protein [Stylosanthes scabra]